ncbi:single-stranded DNA-binding protein [Mammaliicoccus sciuri]|uniref:single-stranded DNA-binding protein n=1 Tax=Mammaliicoccus sciuri TaxID=1296 RepID=UPI0008780F3C|nr:single-stranded DNA-binding protein [Mammaliicoccus sciuri]MBG9204723.1 single-stranded DNA-binding protein [Mammaliicoccus sciuri]RIN98769.1 single-stranded DNA-binding protein [Mammaliicoccus sciuri]WQK75354.1 single-stranded DNA-binding protein [Mammaliicoccus sciuri]WRY64259.1 single-stranded DNA-binding protein [Mammaliicoccus sciuri]
MINSTTLVGRLTKDPELRTTPSGVEVGNFTLAVNRTFTNQNGEREADFINCIVFRKQAVNVNQYLSKGKLAGIVGRLQTRSYENKEGQKVYVTEVVCDNVQFLEPKDSQNDSNSYQNGTNYQKGNNYSQNNQNVQKGQNKTKYDQQNNPFTNGSQLNDDDLPF